MLVQTYSSRSLAFPSDKLPALSVVAEKFGLIFSDDYLAGLWRGFLHFQILWERIGADTPLLPRPRKYQASSWPWASLNVPIRIESRFGSNASDTLMEVLDCQVQPMDEVAPYGAVKSGFLKVRGRMRSVPCEMLREGHYSSTFPTVLDVPGLTTKFDAIEDDLTGEDPASEPLSIFLLGIAPM
jgi:hypothetical protein